MEQVNEKPKENRWNEPGRKGFLPGNPGKPKGLRHMSTLLEEAIRKVANDTGDPEDIAIVKKVIELAKKGDMKAIEHIWDRLEGKAPQKIELNSDTDTEERLEELEKLSSQFNEFLKQSS